MPLELTWSVVTIIGALIIIGAVQLLAKGQKGKSKRVVGTWLGVIVGLVGIIALLGVAPTILGGLNNPVSLDFGTAAVVDERTVDAQDTGGTGACPVQGFVRVDGVCTCLSAEDVTVTVSGQNAYVSSASGGTHRYIKNGEPALTLSDAGTFTASPGDAVTVLFGNGSSTTFYGAVKTQTIKCQGTDTISATVYRNSTLTIRVFNEEGNLVSSTNGENETLAAGDVVNLDIDLQGTYQYGFPYGGVLVAEFNNSAYDDVIIDVGGSKTNVPNLYTVTYTDSSVRAYTVPPLLSNQKVTGVITIDADDTVNPGEDANGDILLRFYPNDYFINEDVGGIFDGPTVEDEDDAQTFAHISTLTLSTD